MKEKLIVTAEHPYEISFSDVWQKEFEEILGKKPTLLVTTEKIAELINLPKDLESRTFYIPDGEEAKNQETLSQGWRRCEELGLDRSDQVVAVGGGSVTDFAGFLAATWLRGISWVAIPTTLAGMVDAAIGGKTGINGAFGKNLIGSFHSPSRVLIDISFLASLTDRDFNAGLAEVIKAGFIKDLRILDLLQNESTRSIRNNDEKILELIYRAIRVKAEIVSEDFRESGVRAFLNYGHTLGHAVEQASRYQLRHGEAVSVGLIFASHLSHRLTGLSTKARDQHQELLTSFDLPITFQSHVFAELLELMKKDKKRSNGILRFVLLEELGKPQLVDVADERLLESLYQEVMR